MSEMTATMMMTVKMIEMTLVEVVIAQHLEIVSIMRRTLRVDIVVCLPIQQSFCIFAVAKVVEIQ